jgi:hypothetical protein
MYEWRLSVSRCRDARSRRSLLTACASILLVVGMWCIAVCNLERSHSLLLIMRSAAEEGEGERLRVFLSRCGITRCGTMGVALGRGEVGVLSCASGESEKNLGWHGFLWRWVGEGTWGVDFVVRSVWRCPGVQSEWIACGNTGARCDWCLCFFLFRNACGASEACRDPIFNTDSTGLRRSARIAEQKKTLSPIAASPCIPTCNPFRLDAGASPHASDDEIDPPSAFPDPPPKKPMPPQVFFALPTGTRQHTHLTAPQSHTHSATPRDAAPRKKNTQPFPLPLLGR